MDEVDDSFEIRTVTSPDDPLLPRICEPWQLKVARESLAKGEWDILVALKVTLGSWSMVQRMVRHCGLL